ncbi:hypothetical protein [Natronorubrum sp. FCH18a]|uniref:hypothetical protein n=1 Tax=Natronorubrum sp. FCH18a TaxID=3447018 RepID=UPI003F5119B5
MIPDYSVPEYYIDNLDVDVSPRVQDPIQGSVSLDFDMTDPKLSDAPSGFQCQTRMVFRIYERGKAPWESPELDKQDEPHGSIEVTAIVFVPGPQDEYREYHDSWSEGSYYDLDDDFIYHLESGILQYIVNPIGDLLENSYSGIVPRMRFSRREESESDEVDDTEGSEE